MKFFQGLLILLVVFPVSVRGQLLEELGERGRAIEERRLDELQYTEATGVAGARSPRVQDFARKYDLDISYGGWISWSHIFFKNLDKSDRSQDVIRYLDSYDFRLWTRLERSEKNDLLYLRAKALWTDREVERAYTGPGAVFDAIRLDMAYYQKQWVNTTRFIRAEALLGRQLFRVGRGLVYSGVDDGLRVYLKTRREWALTFAASRLIRSKNDIDSSRPEPGNDASRRNFYYLNLHRRYNLKHDFNFYVVLQRDANRETPEDVNLRFDYNSRYYGTYLTGELVKNLRYWGEFVIERGSSYPAGTAANSNNNAKERISASAFITGLQYFMSDYYGKPTIYAEYLGGSGDPDRRSVTNTLNGNTRGTGDKNFLYFGFYPTGIALAPRLSNINIRKLGFSLKPLEKKKHLDQFQVSYNYYDYEKDEASGVISDLLATRNSKDIGTENDVIVSWRVLSDLVTTFRYGRFKPGDAYLFNNRDSLTFWNLGVTVDF